VHWSSLWMLAQALPAAAKRRRSRPGSPRRPTRPAPLLRSAPATTRTLFLPRRRPRSSTRQATVRLRHPQHRHLRARLLRATGSCGPPICARRARNCIRVPDRHARRMLVTTSTSPASPTVTDDEHAVEGVPTGSKKSARAAQDRGDETDDYEPGHVPLAKGAVGHAGGHRRPQDAQAAPGDAYRSAVSRSTSRKPGPVCAASAGRLRCGEHRQVLNPMTHDSERG